MNREIKFRAYAKGKGWIQGFNLISFHDYYTKGIEPKLKRYDTEWLLSEVIIEQYTGLKDKNRVKIYEGDIIIHSQSPSIKYEVKYQFGGFTPLMSLWFVPFEIEIIGNIHQHPELLKGGDNNG